MRYENLDEIIKKYSEALMEMGQTYGGEAPPAMDSISTDGSEADSDEPRTETTNEASEEEKRPEMPENAETEPSEELSGGENEAVDTEPAVSPPSNDINQGELTSSATFFARVFAGEGAYPVEGAKVVVYRGDDIYAFLETDSNGATKRVSLPSFKESNSLESDNENRSIDYSADVFATGFLPQKELLVSAVGGSEIVLNVLLVPEEERLS